MKSIFRSVRRYLTESETGAGLLFVALASGVLALWIERIFFSGIDPAVSLAAAFAADNPRRLFHFWTLVSLAVSVWMTFVLLRRRLTQRGLQRVLLVAIVHAVGAIRFYDWGLMLLSVLPLFALLPAILLPAQRQREN